MRCAPLYRDLEDMSSANSTTALLRTMRGGNIFRNTDAFDFFFSQITVAAPVTLRCQYIMRFGSSVKMVV